MAIWHVWHTSQAISTMQKRANANNSSMAAAVATKIDSKVNKHVKIIASTKLPIKNRNNFLFVNVHCAVLLIWFNRSAPQQKQTVNLKEMHNWNEIKLIRCVRLFVFCFWIDKWISENAMTNSCAINKIHDLHHCLSTGTVELNDRPMTALTNSTQNCWLKTTK